MVWWNEVSKTNTLGMLGTTAVHGVVTLEGRRVVERSEIHIGLPLFEHVVGHQLALGEASAGHDAVSGRSNLVDAADGAIFGMEQGVKHFLDALRVRGAIKVEGHLFRR